MYPRLPWGAPVSAFPEERLRGQWQMLCWEIFTYAFVLYVMVEVPYRIAFTINLEEQTDVAVCQEDWKIAFDIVSCLVFVVDIVVQMNAAFFVISKMMMKKTGANLMGMINGMNGGSSSVGGNTTTSSAPKRKMRGPSVDLNDLPGV